MTTTAQKHSEIAIPLLRELVKAYTRHPETLKVDGADMTAAVVMTIKGDRDDHPKLVGSAGKHIQAIRTIFAVVGAKMGRKINITLLEPDMGTKGSPTTFTANPNWDSGPLLELLGKVLDASMPCDYELNPVRISDLTTIEVIPAQWCELYEEEFPAALHAIFHAIGKTQGHDVHLNFVRRP